MNGTDKVVEGIIRAIAARSSRRSFLGKVSSLIFGALGVQLGLAQPVRAQQAQDWQKCGAYGSLCGTDCGGVDTACPSQCIEGNASWVACCCDPLDACLYIAYYDCFLEMGNPPNCTTQTKGSKGLQCENISEGNPKPAYGGEGRQFCCSIITQTGVPCFP